ncbi:hypothetical protein ACGFK1_11575 [Mycobacterium sp. NPDC048908]|uniref:hypothetical protein n=1 Tax=Mycobacterium sp. NPDC048908 TaxID=3364292 RepID=UPI00371C570F
MTGDDRESIDPADMHSSLRVLAALIAKGAEPDVVFAAITKEVLRHFGSGTARIIRFETDGTATILANEGTTGPHVHVGERWEGYLPTGLTAAVPNTGRAARVDDYREVPGGEAYVKEGAAASATCRCSAGLKIFANRDPQSRDTAVNRFPAPS